jgi:hypothetical protein
MSERLGCVQAAEARAHDYDAMYRMCRLAVHGLTL